MKNIKISECLMAYHKANRYFDIFTGDSLLGKREHIKNVISLVLVIAEFQHADVDKEFLSICAEHHDDGRVNQYELLGKFWDTKVTHNSLGIDRIDHFLANYSGEVDKLEIDASIEILRDVVLYHGRTQLANLTAESKKYVDLVTAADTFENACSCVSYLVNEVETDAKGYIASNPNADQKFISDFVFEHFSNGKMFDKAKYCTTYAEYVLFAATLATSCIKKYNHVAKVALSQSGYGYDSIISGYKDVFEKTLSPEMAVKAFEILSSMLN